MKPIKLPVSIELLYINKLLNTQITYSMDGYIGDSNHTPFNDYYYGETEVWHASHIHTVCKGTKNKLPIRFLRLDAVKRYILSNMLDREADGFYPEDTAPESIGNTDLLHYDKNKKADTVLRTDKVGNVYNIRDEKGLDDYIRATRNQRLEERDETWLVYYDNGTDQASAESVDIWLHPSLGLKYASYLNEKVEKAVRMWQLSTFVVGVMLKTSESNGFAQYLQLEEIKKLRPITI